MSFSVVVQLILLVLLLIAIVECMCHLNYVAECRKETPEKCEILEYFDKGKNKINKSEDAYYVTIKRGHVLFYNVELRERLSCNQSELLVHFKNQRPLAYKEYKSFTDDEYMIAMFHNFKSCSVLTILSFAILIGFIIINVWTTSESAVNGYDYELGVVNENISRHLKETVEEWSIKKPIVYAKYLITYESLGLFESDAPKSVNEYQYNFIIADAREALITGKITDRELVKTGLPLRDYLYKYAKEYLTEYGRLMHNVINNPDADFHEEVEQLESKYTIPLYCLYTYHVLSAVFTILAVLHLMYKAVMNIIFIVSVKRYRRRVGV